MLSTLPHPRKLSLFLTLSALDLGLTWHLLCNSGGPIGEANPLANWLLSHAGWAGLAVFKAATVLLVIVACLGVERRRPSAGGFVLGLACGVLSLVVGWSVALSVSVATRTGGLIDPDLARLMREEDQIDHRLDAGAEYRAELLRLARELSVGSCRLHEAVDQLSQMKRIADAHWQATLRESFPLPTLQQSLAAHLTHHAVVETREHNPTGVAEVVRRLENEFYDAYPSPPVEPAGRPFHEPKPPFPSMSENPDDGERKSVHGATNKEGTHYEPGRGRKRMPRFYPGSRGPARPGDGHAPDAANPAGLPG